MNPEPTESARILVADDNPTNVLLLSRSLQKQGYVVLTAEDGKSALEVCRREIPDLLLLDVMMPEHDGLEVCRFLKQDPATASIPIIFVTARTDSEQIVEAFTLGGADYITKPFIVREVLARVAVQVRLRQSERELLARNDELERLSSRLADMNVELARLTRTDSLTGLLNRRAWYEGMALEFERCCRQETSFAILMIDVDHFKAYNDLEGHQAGDECLHRLSRELQGACRSLDSIGRYGGEEFIILCPDTGADEAQAVATRIHHKIKALQMIHRASTTAPMVTVSIGISTGDAKSDWEQVIKRADDNLYAAKQAGRNCTFGADVCAIRPQKPDPVTAADAFEAEAPVALSTSGT